MSWQRGIVAVVLAVVLYNLHALWPSDFLARAAGGGIEFFALQDVPAWLHNRAVQRAAFNVILAAWLFVFLWPKERSLPILGGLWFLVQAGQIMAGGNWFPQDWPDWGTLAILAFLWYIIRFKWPVVLRIVWTRRT